MMGPGWRRGVGERRQQAVDGKQGKVIVVEGRQGGDWFRVSVRGDELPGRGDSELSALPVWCAMEDGQDTLWWIAEVCVRFGAFGAGPMIVLGAATQLRV